MMDGLCCLLLGVCMASNDNSLDNFDREAFMQIIQHRIGGVSEVVYRTLASCTPVSRLMLLFCCST
jgi:hypothetical protein